MLLLRGSNGRTALQAAAGGGHLEVVERLLAAKADVNAAAAGDNGRTALQAAAGGGHLEVVERLLAAKADVNAAAACWLWSDGIAGRGRRWPPRGRRAAAGCEGRRQCCCCYFDGRTALQAAAGGGHLEVVERLLAAKANVNAAAAMVLMVGRHCRPQQGAATSRSWSGCWLRRLTSMLLLLSSNGRTALQAAAGGGHLEVVERLLAAKADVNAAAASYFDGRTALQAAAGGGYLEVVERLLTAKADVNAAAIANGMVGRHCRRQQRAATSRSWSGC